jgi:SsrA-binding protein
MAKPKPDKQPRVSNRKARYQYELLDRFEAGIMLRGAEVKSLRRGQASLEEAYARVQGGEIHLINCHIKVYEHSDVQSQDPLRPRKLLLHKRELHKLIPKVEQRGLTLVPVAIYFNERGLAKVDLALARGKARRDKRQDLKRRQQERDIRAALKKR